MTRQVVFMIRLIQQALNFRKQSKGVPNHHRSLTNGKIGIT